MTFTAHKVLLRRSLGRRVTSALIVLSLLLVPLAAIADLLSEIAAGDTDHRAHDHSEEVITWEFIAEIDATGANFSGVTFDDTRITLSDFTDVDFSDSSGTTTSFRRTTVRGGVFDGATLEDADLTDTQFRCIIDPDETTPGGNTTLCPSFIETDFTGADLTSTVFGPIFTTDKLVFSGATFDDADLTDAILAAVAEPCLQTNEVTNEWTCLSFGGDPNPVLPDTTNPATVAGMTFLNASDLRGSNLQDLSFDHGAFSDALLAGTQFEKSAFVDTTFYSADTTCEVLDASATAAELDAETDLCNFLTDNATIKTNFQDTTFTDVNFAEAKLGNATFGDGADGDSDGASFADVDFSAATLAGTDFTNATLADVVPDATFTDAVFDDALLGCTDDPESEAFADDCDDCAIFTGFLDSIPSPVDGVYKIRMRNIDFSNILACSALREDGGDDPLIDDLSQLDLDGAEFFQTDLSAVNFVESSLVAANLSQSTLSSLNFDDAILDAAIAIDSDFVSATFGDHDTDGTGTSLVGATLDSSQFDSATFTNATLAGATARCLPDGDETVCASFNSAVFTNSDLSNVDFTSADLLGTIFQGGSDLSSADFSEAKFDGVTSFAGSQIDGLDLRDVDLQSASPSLFQGKLAFVPDTDLDEDATDALGVRLDSADLSSFDLSGLELKNWNFSDVVFTGVNFTGADLEGATMHNVQLDEYFDGLTKDTFFLAGADLTGADLSGLDLTGHDLTGTNLAGATVTNTDFSSATLSNTKLTELESVCEDGSNCATFTNADLDCADLADTDLAELAVDDAGTPVSEATRFFEFVASDLHGIKLLDKDLTGYYFANRDLSGADLEGTTLTSADLAGATLDGARLADSTICPSTTTCADFTGTSLVTDPGGGACDPQEAADFSGTSFVNAPADLFANIDRGSAECVNFSEADLSYIDQAKTSGFDFTDITEWDDAVLAGALLRWQDFSAMPTDFFKNLGHAVTTREDICTTEDEGVASTNTHADLSETIFSCADLSGKNFEDADLSDAQFVRSTIGGTGFSFTGAVLEGTDFSNVDFTTSTPSLDTVFQNISEVTDDDDVDHPNLRDVVLVHADLSTGTFDLSGADLTGAILDGANLDGVDLTGAILDNLVSLCGAYPASGLGEQYCPRLDNPATTCVTLVGATLTGASFRNVEFSDGEAIVAPQDFFQDIAQTSGRPDLTGTDFSGANLAGMNLDGVDFTGAVLSGLADLCGDEIGCASFEDTRFASDSADELLSLYALDFEQSNIAGADFTNVSLANADLTEVGDLCTGASDCLSITGEHSTLENADLSGLDLTDVSFGAGTSKVIDFRRTSFVGADLATLDLSDRDFTGADFTAADLSDVVSLAGAILASIDSGCDSDDVCTNFDGANLCGVDARAAHFEGSFAGVDAYAGACSEPADFSGATFENISLATADFTNAKLEDVTFSDSATLCEASDCVTLTGASLVGATLSGLDLSGTPAGLLEDAAKNGLGEVDLSEIDFSNSDLSGKVLADANLGYADLSGADLSGADLSNSVFKQTEFAQGAVTDGTTCELAAGGSPVDLRGADLSGADFSRAKNFQRGCILVDLTTTKDDDTRFPAGFDLLTEVPEPDRSLLQATALAALAWLVWHRRYSTAL